MLPSRHVGAGAVVRSRQRELRDAAWLALIPFGMALVFGLLLAPRKPAPESVPLPVADVRALLRTRDADDRLAETTRAAPLPGAVRALGSAMRAFHTLEAHGAGPAPLGAARHDVDAALADALTTGADKLASLRAVQLAAFLDEARGLESTGEPSDELLALAGSFVSTMTAEGWFDGRRLAPREPELRVMFKEMWNAFLGLEMRADLQPTLDEQRVLYAFYLSHAHPARSMRDALAAARRAAQDDKSRLALDEAERAATEARRLERVARLAAIDPAYPALYARGVLSWRRGDYGAAAIAFDGWLRDHPDGPLALRAQNYLRASLDAERPER
jgi:hypothetical protein